MTDAASELATQVIVRQLGRKPYAPVLQAMHDFTNTRTTDTIDEIWLVEHDPVFTQGQAGKAEHLIATGDIPVVQSDRGGQVTYHGPGQMVVYFLIDLRRKNLGVRELVTHIENMIIATLAKFNIKAAARADAPGVYVDEKKICSLGLRIRQGCSFHGLALNVDMELEPFLRINPCGYAGMEMTQMSQLAKVTTLEQVHPIFIEQMTKHLNYESVKAEESL